MGRRKMYGAKKEPMLVKLLDLPGSNLIHYCPKGYKYVDMLIMGGGGSGGYNSGGGGAGYGKGGSSVVGARGEDGGIGSGGGGGHSGQQGGYGGQGGIILYYHN